MGYILGVNAPPTLRQAEQCPFGGHDPSACLLDERGRVVAMEEQERISRQRYGVFEDPTDAIGACLEIAGVSLGDIDVVAVGWDVPRVAAITGEGWSFGSTDAYLRRLGFDPAVHRPELVFVEHHRAHAASAFYAAGIPEAAVLVMDGNGEDESISVFHGRPSGELVRRDRMPQSRSLGDMYAAVSRHLNLGLLNAGKTMGLASYGRGAGLDPFPMLDEEGRPLFAHHADMRQEAVMQAWRGHLARLAPKRLTPSRLLHEDTQSVRLAWSAQVAVEQQLVRLVEWSRKITGADAVCLSGGVALNCSANGRLDGAVFCPPVPHDGGVALGAAWTVRRPALPERMDPFLGSSLRGEVPADLRAVDLDLDRVVDLLVGGAVGGVAVGRAEVGPRALGHRSLVAMPSVEGVRDRINVAKSREAWRPLAPVSLASTAARFWEVKDPLQRYMLGATAVTDHAREVMREAVHVDGTARAQIVADDDSPFARILTRMERAGLPPVLINTSLNALGEPIAHSVDDVLRTYEQCALDFLILEDRLIVRE
ncbi:carbamoyltransferase C-terminal domain-containing protein [Streptomyces sp. PanSC9]|uniref:carbamoyltransferase C-terminal domain-containing protein n=1 Tax=Streptomyces sp. PanSC9 TaxID=1520461 RepID=UPI000FAC9017|nr:carbamoyltransferase C-terminal domain-containing protein [Streptomyces sp. PanSC9]ROP44429.1 carbamoyltransferase [Streptomyces sp. PanSC9]